MPLVLNMMQQADEFADIDVNGKSVYASVFEVDKNKVHLILGIIDMASSWKGFSIFYNQLLLNDYHKVESALYCYLKAQQCNDYKAHCNSVYIHKEYQQSSLVVSIYPDPHHEEPKISKWLIPCKQLYRARQQVKESHPSSLHDQLQALSVVESCHWCPLLDITDFGEIDAESNEH